MVNEIATSIIQQLLNHPCHDGSVEPVHAEWTPQARNRSGLEMKHEAILAEREWLPRDPRVGADFDVRVCWNEGEIEAQILNVSADGFRLRSTNPLQVGWEVTLESARYDPVKAIICWACGHDAGGVFAEALAL